MDELNDESLYAEFIEEALDLIASSEECLLKLENSEENQGENINLIFRAYHSLKGGAGMLDLTEVVSLAHVLENKLDGYRTSNKSISPNDHEYFLAGMDLLKHMLEALQKMSEAGDTVTSAGFAEDVGKFLHTEEKSDIVLENLEEFKGEARENLEAIESALLLLENGGGSENLDEIFRCAHSIKGASDYAGGKLVTHLAHAFESALDKIRKQKTISLSQSQIDILLEVTDLLRDIVEHCEQPTYRKDNVDQYVRQIQDEFLNGRKITQAEEPVEEKSHYHQILKQQFHIFDQFARGFIEQKDLSFIKGIKRTTKNIAATARFQKDSELDEISKSLNLLLSCEDLAELDQNLIQKEVEDYYSVLQGRIVNLEKSLNQEDEIPVSSNSDEEKQAQTSDKKTVTTLKIGQEIADNFTNLVGELIVAKNSLMHVIDSLKKANVDIDESIIGDSTKISNNIAQLTNELNYNVMKMRMVPVKHIFQKFPRLVRDLSKKVNKKVKLEIVGEETEIDKAIAESLFDPLVHMIRNSLDHGIEKSDKRREVGKPEEATVTLRAVHEGSSIVIEVRDDGGGVNEARVKETAIKRGVATEESIAKMTHNEVISLIMAPGFSTAEKVTDLSGRGVGMDVVKNNIEKLKGRVNLFSKEGEGTCFRLELPLTMAISEVLIVQATKQTYALQIENILEIVKVPYSSFNSILGEDSICLRGEVISLMGLHYLMYPESEKVESIGREGLATIIIIQVQGSKVGICVDNIVKKQEVVIRALPSVYGGSTLVSGTSILGDGRSVLILDTSTVLQRLEEIKESENENEDNQQIA